MTKAGTKRKLLSTSVPAALLAAVKEAVTANGYRSLLHGCHTVDLDYACVRRILSEGLAANPRVQTVEKLRRLGILHLVPRRVA